MAAGAPQSVDMDKVQRNLAKLQAAAAPERDIRDYLAGEGLTLEQVRPAAQGAPAPQPDASGAPGMSREQAHARIADTGTQIMESMPGAPRIDPNTGAAVGGALAGIAGAPVALGTGPLAPLTEAGIVTLGAQVGREAARAWNEHVAGEPDDSSVGERLLRTGSDMVTDLTFVMGGPAAGKALGAGWRGAQNWLKGVMGGASDESAQALKAFRDAGVEPSAGMVGGRFAQGSERALEKLPLSSGIMQRKTDQVREQLARAAERVQRTAGPQVDEMAQAGAGIRHGLRTGIEARKAQFEDAYRFVPGLARQKVDITGAQVLAEEIIAQESKGLGDDAALRVARAILTRKGGAVRGPGGTIPFDEAVKLRSDLLNLGRTGDAEVAGAAQAAAQRLAGALDTAMESGAARAVQTRALTPAAFQEWRQINKEYAAFQQQLKTVGMIARSETAENAFKLTLAGAGDGASRLQAVKGLMPEEAWQDVVTFNLGRLGLETPGAGSTGELYFSPARWLTNVRGIRSEESRALLFGAPGTPLRKAVDDLTAVAGKLKEGQFLANPSGTAGQSQFMNLMSGANLGTAPVTFAMGHPLLAGAQVAAQLGVAPGMAKLFTWPKFVEWYAEAAKIPPQDVKRMAMQMAALPRLADAFPEYRDALLGYVDGVTLMLPGERQPEAATPGAASGGDAKGGFLEGLGRRLGIGKRGKAGSAPGGAPESGLGNATEAADAEQERLETGSR